MCGPSCSTDSSAENDDTQVCRFCGGAMEFFGLKNFSNAIVETKYKCTVCGRIYSEIRGGRR